MKTKIWTTRDGLDVEVEVYNPREKAGFVTLSDGKRKRVVLERHPDTIAARLFRRRRAGERLSYREYQQLRDHYFASASWSDKRTFALRDARGVCQHCHVSPAREVHHVHYDNFGEENPAELEALCRQCHEWVSRRDPPPPTPPPLTPPPATAPSLPAPAARALAPRRIMTLADAYDVRDEGRESA